MMKSIAVTLLVASICLTDAAFAHDRKAEIRNMVHKNAARKLASVDETAGCYGDTKTFSVNANDSTDAKTFIVQYPKATNGNQYTCTFKCDQTTGEAYVQAVITSATTINSGEEGEKKTELVNGCATDLTLDVTAGQNDNLLAAGYCALGCSGSLTCTEKCNSSFQWMYNKVSEFVFPGGHGRGRRLSKYIRGAAETQQ